MAIVFDGHEVLSQQKPSDHMVNVVMSPMRQKKYFFILKKIVHGRSVRGVFVFSDILSVAALRRRRKYLISKT